MPTPLCAARAKVTSRRWMAGRHSIADQQLLQVRTAFASLRAVSHAALTLSGLIGPCWNSIVPLRPPPKVGASIHSIAQLGSASVGNEHEPLFYLGRLVTFGLIIFAIVDKNTGAPKH
jgi:hypothetical protein